MAAEIVSPYTKVEPARWEAVTRKLIATHPLKEDEIVNIVLEAMREVYATKLGSRNLRVGTDIFPNPQIIGFFLHELIPALLAERYPGKWRRERDKSEKDAVYIPDARFSIEIKTSSNPRSIFGNRSYAQKTADETLVRKSKFGYFLAVNFQSTQVVGSGGGITRIRFGWLDHSDWVGQEAPTGQQAHLTAEADKNKLYVRT